MRPSIAKAMVDADVEGPALSDKGKLLTLTTDEALEHRVADFRADTLDAVLTAVDVGDADVCGASADVGGRNPPRPTKERARELMP